MNLAKVIARKRILAWPVAVWLGVLAMQVLPVAAQTQTPAAPPATTTPAPAAPAANNTPNATPAPDPNKPSGDASSAQILTLQARPVALWKGTATWDEGYKAITDSFHRITDTLAKAGIKPTGRPLAMFTETDDNGFKFQGMIPIEKPGEAGTTLSDEVAFGELPAGKAVKFQHRGAYDEIDATYEAITAYLDEKGYEAKNLFIEEYLNDVKGSDDTSLAVDIYVYVK